MEMSCELHTAATSPALPMYGRALLDGADCLSDCCLVVVVVVPHFDVSLWHSFYRDLTYLVTESVGIVCMLDFEDAFSVAQIVFFSR
jgi:hypothetical protein